MPPQTPRYPEIRVSLFSRNPFALVSAVRQGLRRFHVDSSEIERFTEEALAAEEPDRMKSVCAAWAAIDLASTR